MSELLGIWAELRLPAAAVAPWLASRVQGAAWDDWCGLLVDAGSTDRRARVDGTVKDLLDEGRKVGKHRAHYELHIERGEVQLRAVLSLDDDLDACVKVVTALRGAERHGATGEVVVLGMPDESRNAQVRVARGRSRCSKAPPARRTEVAEALEQSSSSAARKSDDPAARLVRELEAHIDGNIAQLRSELAAPEALALHERLLDALARRCPQPALVAWHKTRQRRSGSTPARSATAATILERLREDYRKSAFGTTRASLPVDTWAPLELLSQHDFATAEAIALDLIERRPNGHAVELLAQSTRPEARDALLRQFAREPASSLVAALTAMRDQGVAERVLPLLPPAVEAVPGGWTSDEHVPPTPYGSVPEVRRVLSVCTVLCAHPFEPAYAAVARLYQDLIGSLRARVFERNGEWWFRRVVGGVAAEGRIGPASGADAALVSVTQRSRALCIALDLGRRLLLDGQAPKQTWWGGRLPERGLKQVDALLKRRRLA